MKEQQIGSEGKHLNFSSASSAMNREPDIEQIVTYDEYPVTSNPLQYIVLVVAIGISALCFYLAMQGSWILFSICVIATLFLFLLSRSLGKATTKKAIAYQHGLLIPAIITSTHPLQLIAMADMGSSEKQEPVYGCIKFTIQQLPHHTLQVDEKVPCVALFGMAVKGYRRHFEPRPVAWGYTEKALIAEAIAAINYIEPDEQDDETEIEPNDEAPEQTAWEILYSLKNKMNDAPEKEVVFFDKELNRITL